jgi:adenosylcobinamide-phosphate synthase
VSISLLELLLGVAADLLLGDPRWLPHPIRGFGWVASRLERVWRKAPFGMRLAGAGFWLSAVGVACLVVWLSLRMLPRPWITVYWIFSLLALRDLDRHAGAVNEALKVGDLTEARRKTAMIVGRDTASLDEKEILRATFESVAENLNDAVIAPLFYLALTGPLGMAAYKAVNTLDSMVGYRSPRYREFGWVSARVDDLANWVPARLSALLVWLCALRPGFDFAGSVRATLRDARRQPSPNAGYPEAAVAGALGVRLGGVNFYAGMPSPKEFLGDPVRPLDRSLYSRLRWLLYGPSLAMIAFLCGVLPWW